MCQVGVCNEGRCSLMAIGLSNDGKRVFNKACAMAWCHTVVHFEVKMSRFSIQASSKQASKKSLCRHCGSKPASK